uniref:Gustatory receptor n=1 Tax=Anopheles melas TaxID=34690 RepID=A0A182UD44_9DIPT
MCVRKDQHTISLNLFTIYARLLVTVLIVVLLICDNFRQRFHLLSLLHTIPGSAFTGRTGSQFSVKKLQLVILLICNVLSISEALYKIYQSRQYSYCLGVFSGVLVEHYILLNLLLCQLLAETLSNAHATLQHSLRVRPFHTIISELTVLDGCKNHLSEVIGLKLILVILHLMFNVSFCTYDILEHVLSEKHLRGITRLSIIAVQETVMLFGLCFQFTMLDRKFWPAFLSNRYAKLISRTAYRHNHSLQTVMALGSDLESFKRKCSSIFGLMQLLHLLNIFVTCSVEAYIVFHVVDMGLGVHYVAMNLVAALTYGASFLIYTYAHNLVNVKVGTILILLIAAVFGDVYMWWRFIAKQKLYYILNIMIVDHFNELACRVKNEPDETDLLQTVNTIWDDLEHYKQRTIATFGVMNVLHALDALVKCAVETYVIFSTWEMGFGLLGAFLEIITLTVYAATFFIFAFAHDRVEVKVSASNCCFKHPSRTC